MAIHYFAHIVAGEFAVVVNLEFVGIHIVDAIFALQVFAEEGESSAEDGNLVAIALEHSHQSVNALGDGQFLGDVLHHAHVEPLEQCYSLLEALLEVDLASHGSLGYLLHFIAHSGAHGEFVDTLRLNECGVHIKADESAHAAEHVVALQREVEFHLRRQLHQLRAHVVDVDGGATQREFDASPHVALWMLDALATGEAHNRVDVQSLVLDDYRCCRNLSCIEMTSDDGEDVAVFALLLHPTLVFLVVDGGEGNVHS